ncbi:hypothetical protein BLN97_14170 [Bradyrhizobium elkanii]|nr:hypothetical protein BLN97_14170 [Bradyrhizobium elkanii]
MRCRTEIATGWFLCQSVVTLVSFTRSWVISEPGFPLRSSFVTTASSHICSMLPASSSSMVISCCGFDIVCSRFSRSPVGFKLFLGEGAELDAVGIAKALAHADADAVLAPRDLASGPQDWFLFLAANES